jgi:hypothetical protein
MSSGTTRSVAIDVSNDLGLPRDHGVERRTSGCGQGIPELYDRRPLERAVHSGDVLHDLGVIHLRVACQQSVDDRNADAGSDVARQAEEPSAFGPLFRCGSDKAAALSGTNRKPKPMP